MILVTTPTLKEVVKRSLATSHMTVMKAQTVRRVASAAKNAAQKTLVMTASQTIPQRMNMKVPSIQVQLSVMAILMHCCKPFFERHQKNFADMCAAQPLKP